MADIYVLSLLHFNLQYCAGGLEELLEDWPADNAALEDQIVEQSFAPVLGMLEAHPDWTMSLEVQAYMVEVMAERHPETLARLQALADGGQVELVSWHWSDQLWTAFPWRDQQVSLELTRAVFDAHGLPLSDVVFTQEGQFGEGMLVRMPEHGYRVAVMPKNLAEWTWGAQPASTLYTYGDVVVIPGGTSLAGPGDAYQVWWHFLNDGELYATDDMNCYLGPAFQFDPDALAEKEAELVAMEEAGGRIVGISAYVAAVEGLGSAPLPPVVDGTWQPDDTGNVYRWMGGAGLWAETEDDDLVRTTNVRARHAVAAAEVVPGADPVVVEEAWRALLLGEVSDSTGWNPYASEVAYSLEHSAAAEDLASLAIGPACAEAGADRVLVDVATGGFEWNGELADEGGVATDAPFELTTTGRPATVSWARREDDVVALEITWGAGQDPVAASLPWDGQTVATIPALLEHVVEIDPAGLPDPAALPLPLGLARLSEGVWLVKDTQTTHLAGHFSTGAGALSFLDETMPEDEARTWRFLVVTGDEARATEVALATNSAPVVELACPAGEGGEGVPLPHEGCGCGTGGLAPGIAVVLAALAAGRRRHT